MGDLVHSSPTTPLIVVHLKSTPGSKLGALFSEAEMGILLSIGVSRSLSEVGK